MFIVRKVVTQNRKRTSGMLTVVRTGMNRETFQGNFIHIVKF